MIQPKMTAMVLAMTALAMAADDSSVLKTTGALDRLLKQTGVYNASTTGKTPGFVVDPSWPQPLPNNWLLGQIGGLYVDQHDHVWIYNRPRTLTNEEAGLEGPVAKDEKGQPVNGLGHVRAYGPVADCCKAAPSVLEFDVRGKLLRAWGGPADPGFIGGKCKAEAGCIWPNSEHGIYVDQNDNVWISGNSDRIRAAGQPQGPALDHQQRRRRRLRPEVRHERQFQDADRRHAQGPNSNDTNGGINGTPLLYQAADMVVDPTTNRLYVSDGYGNRRVLIVDADYRQIYRAFRRLWKQSRLDDAAAAAAGTWIGDYAKGNKKPAFFRNPVHCVKIANDGKIYVCDRGNDRIQVFDKNDPALGKPCSNPTGEPGKCGFVAEQFISEHTNIIGTAVSMNFSTDKAQSCLYVGDNANMTIYILNRSNLQELGRLGRSGRMRGRLPLAASGERGQQGQHLHRGSRYRKTHPEIPPLRRDRMQRHRLGDGRRTHQVATAANPAGSSTATCAPPGCYHTPALLSAA